MPSQGGTLHHRKLDTWIQPLACAGCSLFFDPCTRPRAQGRPRILINDGFSIHESLEILKYCFEQNIILCRLPSHTSHKIQPCDADVFGSLKTAYREQVEKLYRGGANAVGKAHFPSFSCSCSRCHLCRSQTSSRLGLRSGFFRATLTGSYRALKKSDFAQNVTVQTAPPRSPLDQPLRHDEKVLRTPVTSDGLSQLRNENWTRNRRMTVAKDQIIMAVEFESRQRNEAFWEVKIESQTKGGSTV